VWNGVVQEDREALSIPYGWKKPRKIFVNSMSEGVSDDFVLGVWKVMRETPRHSYRIFAPTAIRVISFEPLIGSTGAVDLKSIHWAVVGESGILQAVRTWGKDNKKRSKKANGREYRGQTWDEMLAAPQGARRM
jgi:protein gp37